MCIGTAQLLRGNILTSHGLDHAGAGDKHIGVAGLNDEVSQRRRIGSTTSTGAGDDGNLRHQTGQQHVIVEHLAVAREGIDTLLDAGSTRVIDKDERRARVSASLHHGSHFVRLGFTSGTAHHSEVLRRNVSRATEDGTRTSHHTVSRRIGLIHSKVRGAVGGKHAGLLERIFIHQGVDTLASGELAALMLFFDLVLATAKGNASLLLVEPFKALLHCGFSRHVSILLRPVRP